MFNLSNSYPIQLTNHVVGFLDPRSTWRLSCTGRPWKYLREPKYLWRSEDIHLRDLYGYLRAQNKGNFPTTEQLFTGLSLLSHQITHLELDYIAYCNCIYSINDLFHFFKQTQLPKLTNLTLANTPFELVAESSAEHPWKTFGRQVGIQCSSLTNLRLRYFMNRSSLESFMEGLNLSSSQLTHLDVSDCLVNTLAVEWINKLPKLTNCSAAGIRETIPVLKVKALTHLSVEKQHFDLENIDQCSGLRTLIFHRIQMTLEIFSKTMKGLVNLTDLTIDHCKIRKGNLDGKEINQSVFQAVTSLPKLRCLKLDTFQVITDAFGLLKDRASLEELDLRNTNMIERGWHGLSQLANLRKLTIIPHSTMENDSIAAKLAQIIPKLSKLQILQISPALDSILDSDDELHFLSTLLSAQIRGESLRKVIALMIVQSTTRWSGLLERIASFKAEHGGTIVELQSCDSI